MTMPPNYDYKSFMFSVHTIIITHYMVGGAHCFYHTTDYWKIKSE